MYPYIQLFEVTIPAYGFIVTIGLLTANLIAFPLIRKYSLDINDFIIMECFCMLGAFIGAKLLYFVVSYKSIEWRKIFQLTYFNALMQGGFVFYGGLFGGIFAVIVAGRMQNIDANKYVRNFIFLLPLIHGFGRIGCFMAGCCYGIPYTGIGSVIYPEHSFAVPGVQLFPVQLTEAFLLFIIGGLILYFQMKKDFRYTIELYLVLYGTVRFILEFLRYDSVRGIWGILSAAQWISIFVVFVGLISFIRLRRYEQTF